MFKKIVKKVKNVVKKLEKAKKVLPPKVEEKVAIVAEVVSVVATPIEVVKELPTYNNLMVVKILEEGNEWNHCKMSDGSSMHVPIGLFN